MRENLEFFYERELDFIRNLSAEFARDRPKIADRLLLDAGHSQDPHVERLIEAFAFLTARIRLKLDDDFPELVEAILGSLYPHYLAPIPSMGIAQFEPDPNQGTMTGGYTIARHSQLTSPEVQSQKVRNLRCRFRTAYPVTLWPVEVVSASYQSVPFAVDNQVPAVAADAVAMIKIELRTTGANRFSEIDLNQLRFFLQGDDRHTHLLYELLLNHRICVSATTENAQIVLPKDSVSPVGFERDEGLLPYGPQSFLGYRLLTEYFAFPEKFLFLDILNLQKASYCEDGERLQLSFYLNRQDDVLESKLNTKSFLLGCTPIVNLFQQEIDPIRLTQLRNEYRLVPDVRHASQMEVYSLDSLHSVNLDTGHTSEYQPIYASFQDKSSAWQQRQNREAYWYTSRRPSIRAEDSGTEVAISLVDSSFNPFVPPVEVLSGTATCSNRDLPGKLRSRGGEQWEFQLEGQAPVQRVRPVVLPTKSLRQDKLESRWRLISHLSLNHLSITEESLGADALREILTLYDRQDNAATQMQIAGIVSVKSRRRTARVRQDRQYGFCRGVEIDIEFDPENFTGSGIYLLASVLERFCGLYASINSFTQFSAWKKDAQHPVKRWSPRAGEKTLI
jgi:type VI secretion system protein ImpG